MERKREKWWWKLLQILVNNEYIIQDETRNKGRLSQWKIYSNENNHVDIQLVGVQVTVRPYFLQRKKNKFTVAPFSSPRITKRHILRIVQDSCMRAGKWAIKWLEQKKDSCIPEITMSGSYNMKTGAHQTDWPLVSPNCQLKKNLLSEKLCCIR